MKIESLQNARVKNLVALQQKRRERQKQRIFVVEGDREIDRALKSGFYLVEIWSNNEDFELLSKCDPKKVVLCSNQVFNKIAYREKTVNALALFEMKSSNLETLQLSENPLIIVLENVEKPGNLGAVIRTANGLGIDAVLVCDSSVDIYNPNVIRNSLGGFFHTSVIQCTSAEAIDFFQVNQIQIITTHLEGATNYLDVNFESPTAIVLGAEASGLSDVWVKNTKANVLIAMSGIVDSLNVSVAGAIVMAEAVRQRVKKS